MDIKELSEIIEGNMKVRVYSLEVQESSTVQKITFRHIFLLFVLLGISYFWQGCTWETASEEPYRKKIEATIVADLLIDEYEIQLGKLPQRCKDHLHNVVYVRRGERIYVDSTFALGRLDGMGEHFYDGTSYIWLEPTLTAVQYNAFLLHEQTHALLACLSDPKATGLGDADINHDESDIWCTTGHGCNFDGHDNEDSLEYAMCNNVRYYVPVELTN